MNILKCGIKASAVLINCIKWSLALTVFMLYSSESYSSEDMMHPDLEKQLTSVDLLVQMSQAIAIVTVSDIGQVMGTKDLAISFEVNQTLFGDPPRQVLHLMNRYVLPQSTPEVGQQGILFMSRRMMVLPGPNFIRNRQTIDDVDAGESDDWHVVGGSRGFIVGDNERIRYLGAIVNKFIRNRKSKSGIIEHANFLRKLMDSDDERVQEDIDSILIWYVSSMSPREREMMHDASYPAEIRKWLQEFRARRLQTP